MILDPENYHYRHIASKEELLAKEKQENQDGNMNIVVRTLAKKNIDFCCHPDNTVKVLKLKILDCEGIPPSQQRLLFGGHQLEDWKSLGFYKIKQDSVCHLILRLRGGMYQASSGKEGLNNAVGSEYVHYDVSCDKCKQGDIQGIRYKSMARDNYDLCEECEKLIDSSEIFIKIKNSSEYEKHGY